MASTPILTASDILSKDAALEVKKLEQAMAELVDTEKELITATTSLNKITNKSSKEGLKRAEEVAKLQKKEISLKSRVLNIEKKRLSISKQQAALDKKQLSVMQALNKQWDKFATVMGKAVAAYATIMIFINSFNRLKETVIILDSFNQLMLKVTGSTYAAAESMDYLIGISKDFGISLATATQRYSKFFAAARQAGLTTEETRQIFSSMAKTAGILSLRAEEVQGVFLALEQMLSKGKVTTEELRRQLGERLPGAFGIMARAVGVTTAELDTMLKKGEIISRDILPKFAVEMEKAFGLESVMRIDTLVAAIERSSTAYFELIREIEKGGAISDTVKGTYNIWTSYLEQFTISVRDSRNANLKWYESMTVVMSGLLGLGNFMRLDDDAVEEQAYWENREKLIKDWVIASKDYIENSDKFTKAQKDYMTLAVIEVDARNRNNIELAREVELLDMLKRRQIEEAKLIENTVKWYQFKIKVAKEELVTKITLAGAYSKEAKEIRKNMKEWQEAIDIILGKRKKLKTDGPLPGILNITEPVKGSIDYYSERISGIEGALRNMNAAELARSKKMVEELTFLKEQKKEMEEMLEIYVKMEEADPFDSGIAVGAELIKKKSRNINTIGDGSVSGIFESPDKIQQYADEYDKLDVDKRGKWEDYLATRRDGEEAIYNRSIDLTNEMFEIGNAIFDRKIENINAEIKATEEKYDRLKELAKGDVEHERAIERDRQVEIAKLEKKELKARQQQARYNKAQAVFNAGISMAVAINTMLTGGPGVGFVMAALAAAIGAAQIAAIIAAPIPQYKMGREGGPAELALVGDGGKHEIISGKSGVMKTPNKPTLTYLEKGDNVYRNEHVYKEMLRRTNSKNMNDAEKVNFDKAIERGLSKAKIKHFTKMPAINIDLDHAVWLAKNSQF